jgi:hypothetical protein
MLTIIIQAITGRLVISSLSRFTPSSWDMSLCRRFMGDSFGTAFERICRRCFFLQDLQRRSIPPTTCFFAECPSHYTQQRTYTGAQVLVLCRVLWFSHSAKRCFAECYTRQSDQYTPFLFVFPIPSKQTKDISQISHIYITDHHRHI